MGRVPSAVGYQPTLATDMGSLLERITSTKRGSITSVQAICVPADDLGLASHFFYTSGCHHSSESSNAEFGIYPVVDPSESNSQILDPEIVGEEHHNVAREVQRILQTYNHCKISQLFLAWMSHQRKISLLLVELEKFKDFYLSLFPKQKFLLVLRVNLLNLVTQLQDLKVC